MKKLAAGLFAALLCLATTGCQPNSSEYFTDDEPEILELSSNHLRVMQITDLHMMFGIDAKDNKTLNLISAMANETDPDLIYITGDMSMTTIGPMLFGQLYNFMEGLDIPWTFVFGNHETMYNSYDTYLSQIADKTDDNLLFKVGPEIDNGGRGNYIIETTYNDVPFFNLYGMDSKDESNGVYEYDYFSEAQVDWYAGHAAQDAIAGVNNAVFMHIPLKQYEEYTDYTLIDGQMGEDRVYPQGLDTGIFTEMVNHGVTKGVFCGHDHLSDFSFIKDGIMLAYGRRTGYNAYGALSRGARIIDIDSNKNLTSFILDASEVA